MFCPKCSQQQVNDETRFCSRCGFELNIVKALLSSESNLQSVTTPVKDRSTRNRDMTIGAFLMFVLAFLAAMITFDTSVNHPARIVFLVFALIGLMLLINIKPMILYFLRGDTPAQSADDFSLTKAVSKLISRNKRSLPEYESIPAGTFAMPRGADTAEMVQPSSITEETTNLLNKTKTK